MVEDRCYKCTRVKPLDEFVIAPFKMCLDCFRKQSLRYNRKYREKGGHAAYRKEHRRLRRQLSGWLGGHCDECNQNVRIHGSKDTIDHRDTWVLFPATTRGRRLLAELPKLSLYSLDRDQIEGNFKILCRACYHKAVEEEEGCRGRMDIVKVKP